MVRIPTLLLLVSALAGCGTQRAATPGGAAVDPATRLALEAPLLVDPALDTQARRFAVGVTVLGGGGGILFVAGFSRLFTPMAVGVTMVLAVLPIPLTVWLFGINLLG